MFMKPRKIPKELLLLRMLKPRMFFSEELNFLYENMEKGFQGEVQFDSFLETLTIDSIVLNDLQFKVNRSDFQIDSLLIYSKGIIMFEVKNYRGEYYIDNKIEKWFTFAKKDIQNPLLQIQRSETLFRQLLQQYRTPSIDIHSHVMFVHDEFTLFQAPLNLPIIMPSQLNSYFFNLNNSSTSKLTQRHYDLANKLLNSHAEQSPYLRLPKYDFNQLKKGIVCPRCQSFMLPKKRTLMCDVCQFTELINIGIERSVNEFQSLFPTMQITSKVIHNWVDQKAPKKTIRLHLMRRFNRIGYGPGTYYVNEKFK